MYNSKPANSWRNIKARSSLVGGKCKRCDKYFYPAKDSCDCGGKVKEIWFKGTGKVISFTKVHVPPAHLEKQIPYTIGIIELDEGVRLTAQIVDHEDLKAGTPVEACLRRIFADGKSGIINYGIKFRPVDGQ